MTGPTGSPQGPFELDSGYRRYVDGRSREDGVGAFLAGRGIDVPVGASGDPQACSSPARYRRYDDRRPAQTPEGAQPGGAHERIHVELLVEHGVEVFCGTRTCCGTATVHVRCFEVLCMPWTAT